MMKKKNTKARVKSKGKTRTKARKTRPSAGVKKVVRIMGQGQFYVDVMTVKKLKSINNSLVEFVASEKLDDAEFRAMLGEFNHIAMKYGKPVEGGEIVRSDIILPSVDLSVDEAKRLFSSGEGVIPN